MNLVTSEVNNWTHEKRCRAAVATLIERDFTAVYCESAAEAREYIIREAASAKTVGIGGSFSLSDLKVLGVLEEQGKEILNHGAPDLSDEERRVVMERQQTCDLFISGTNALTLDGLLVNIDGNGNRVAAMIYGPKKVIVLAGRNKLVSGGLDEAFYRIKEMSAPANAMRLDRDTPCAETGFCEDCDSPERICRVTTFMERRPRITDFHVLVVNEDMGL